MVRRELRLRNQKSCTRDSKACTATCLLQTCFPIVQWALSPPFRVVVMTRLCAQGSTGPRGCPAQGRALPSLVLGEQRVAGSDWAVSSCFLG